MRRHFYSSFGVANIVRSRRIKAGLQRFMRDRVEDATIRQGMDRINAAEGLSRR